MTPALTIRSGLAALLLALLTACAPPEAPAPEAPAPGADSMPFLDIDLEGFEAGWDCTGTYPRGEFVNSLNGYRLYRIGPIDDPALPTRNVDLFAVEGSRAGCRFMSLASETDTLRLPLTMRGVVGEGLFGPFVNYIRELAFAKCGSGPFNEYPPIKACAEREEARILNRVAEFDWVRTGLGERPTDVYETQLLFIDGRVIDSLDITSEGISTEVGRS